VCVFYSISNTLPLFFEDPVENVTVDGMCPLSARSSSWYSGDAGKYNSITVSLQQAKIGKEEKRMKTSWTHAINSHIFHRIFKEQWKSVRDTVENTHIKQLTFNLNDKPKGKVARLTSAHVQQINCSRQAQMLRDTYQLFQIITTGFKGIVHPKMKI